MDLEKLIATCRKGAKEGDARFEQMLPCLLAVRNPAAFAKRGAMLSANEEVMEVGEFSALEHLEENLRSLGLWPLSPKELQLRQKNRE
jgi:hypothetical protein